MVRVGAITAQWTVTKSPLSLAHLAVENYGRNRSVVLITGVDDASFKRLVRARTALFAGGRKEFVYAFSQLQDASGDDLKLAGTILGKEVLTYSVDALTALIQPDLDFEKAKRKAAAQESASKALRVSRYIMTPAGLADAISKPEEVVKLTATRDYSATFESVFADTNGVLIVGTGWKRAYMGAVNGNKGIVGKNLYIYDRALSAAEANELLQFKERIYFTPNALARSKVAETLQEGRIFDASVFVSTLKNASLASLLRSAGASLGYRISPQAVARLKPYLKDESTVFTAVLDSLLDTEAKSVLGLSNTTALATIRARFGEEHLDAANKITVGLSRAVGRGTIEARMARELMATDEEPDTASRLGDAGYAYVAAFVDAFDPNSSSI